MQFNLARAIDAFSPRTLRYKGQASDAVWESVSVGGLLQLNLEENDLSASEDEAKMLSALSSLQCRIRELKLPVCSLTENAIKQIALLIETNALALSYLDLRDNSLGPEGAAHIGQAIAKSKSLMHLVLEDNSLEPEGAEYVIKGMANPSAMSPVATPANEL